MKMRRLGIDPGTYETAYALYEFDEDERKAGRVVEFGILPNEDFLGWLSQGYDPKPGDMAAMEMIGHYGTGMSVGIEVFATCVWIGRFMETLDRRGLMPDLLGRKSVVRFLCSSDRAKDKHVRQALIDRLGKPGTAKKPGPTFGVATHVWAALAVAVASANDVRPILLPIKEN